MSSRPGAASHGELRRRQSRANAAALSNRELLVVLDRISDGFFALDHHWRFTYINSRAQQILGASDLIGRHIWAMYPEAGDFKTRYEAAMAEQKPQHFTAFYEPHDRWYEAHAYPSPEGLTVYFRDVTEQYRIEREMRLMNERFRLVARATQDVIFDRDLVTGAAWRSEAIQTKFGYPQDEISQNIEWWSSRVHPRQRTTITAALQRFLESDDELWTYQYRFRRHDGTYADVMSRVFAVRDHNGKALRIIGALTDLSQAKQAEKLIQESRKRLRALSQRLMSVQEHERKQIARDVHDLLGHSLAVIKFRLHQAEEQAKLPAADVADIQRLVDDAVNSVRNIARSLRPPTIDGIGLHAAVEREVRTFQERTGTECDLDLDPRVDVEPERAITVYRILQEALTNVARHSGAKRVEVTIYRRSGRVHLRVADDGRGIGSKVPDDGRSLGILGMHERALLIAGTLRVSRGRSGGTVVALSFPMSSEDT